MGYLFLIYFPFILTKEERVGGFNKKKKKKTPQLITTSIKWRENISSRGYPCLIIKVLIS